MIFNLQPAKNRFIERVYEKAMKELNEFFEIGWVYNRTALIIMKNRKSFDIIRRRKTKDWETALSTGGRIFILSPKAFKKESSHKYSKQEYFRTIKHELCHEFYDIIQRKIIILYGLMKVWQFS